MPAARYTAPLTAAWSYLEHFGCLLESTCPLLAVGQLAAQILGAGLTRYADSIQQLQQSAHAETPWQRQQQQQVFSQEHTWSHHQAVSQPHLLQLQQLRVVASHWDYRHTPAAARKAYSTGGSTGVNSSRTCIIRSRQQILLASPATGLQLWPTPSMQLTQQQQQQRCGFKQLIPHALAPKPSPRFRKPSKDGRLNRMVIRIPPQVQVALQDKQLKLTGKAGSTVLQLPHLDPTGLVAWQCHTQSAAAVAAGPGTGSLLLLASPSKRCWRGIQTHIDNAVHGVMQGYLVGLTVQGVGYRMEPVANATLAAALGSSTGEASSSPSSSKRIIWEQEAEKSNIAYPHKQPARAVRLKVGYTRACIFPLPDGVLGFFVKPTLMYLYGIDKALVTNTAAAMRAVRKPNAYTGNGIQLVGETIKLKQRAGSK
eukprot:GHRR01014133.1.p1 GENE.GHRR01014133.1~~GHRR01014133.1.p1  ORF type:complete len:426 (+),score=168.68 GHRR01014133.1:344-1621(+)